MTTYFRGVAVYPCGEADLALMKFTFSGERNFTPTSSLPLGGTIREGTRCNGFVVSYGQVSVAGNPTPVMHSARTAGIIPIKREGGKLRAYLEGEVPAAQEEEMHRLLPQCIQGPSSEIKDALKIVTDTALIEFPSTETSLLRLHPY